MRIGQINRLVIVGYGLMSVLTVAAIVAGDHYVQGRDAANWRREQTLQLADQLLAGSQSLTASVRAFAATGDGQYRNAYFDEVNSIRSRDKAVDGLRALKITDDEAQLIERAKANSDQLIDLEKRSFAAGEAGDLGLAVDLVYGPTYQAALASIYGPIDQFRVRLQDRLAAEGAQAQRDADLSRWIAWSGILLNILAVLSLLTLFYRHRVIRPLLRLDQDVKRLLTGDRSAAIGLQEDPSEIGDLARSFEAFRQMEAVIERQRQNKRQAAELSLALRQARDWEALGTVYLSRLADWLGVRHGVFHTLEPGATALRCVAGYGVEPGVLGQVTALGSGLAGQCAMDRRPLRVADPPADYLRIVSGTGMAPAADLLIRPLLLNESLFGVVELASFRCLGEADLELLEDLEQILVMNLANLEHGPAPSGPGLAPSVSGPAGAGSSRGPLPQDP